MSTRRSALIFTCSKLSFSTLDQNGTLERSFFDFINNYLMPRKKTTKKLQKTAKSGILISNALFITIKGIKI